MRSKSRKSTKVSHPAKENCPVSGNHQKQGLPELPHLKVFHKIGDVKSLGDLQKPLSFEEVHRMCMKQEKQVLSEVKSTNLEHNFYEFCESELKGLHIFKEI